MTAQAMRQPAKTGTWLWPLLIIFIRFPLIMLGNLLVYGYTVTFLAQERPWSYALMWGNVHTSLIADVVTLLLLAWLLRREGLRLRDLLNWQGEAWGREIVLGVGIALLLLVVLFVGNVVGALVAFGPAVFSSPPAMPTLTRADLPPLWFYLWGLLVLPVTVAVAEELAYRGYAQPRLAAWLGNRWLAVLLVAVGFGVQHIAFAFTDWQAALARFVGTFLAGLVFGVLYLRQRRLLPLIIGHWLVDVVGLGLMPLWFYLSLA